MSCSRRLACVFVGWRKGCVSALGLLICLLPPGSDERGASELESILVAILLSSLVNIRKIIHYYRLDTIILGYYTYETPQRQYSGPNTSPGHHTDRMIPLGSIVTLILPPSCFLLYYYHWNLQMTSKISMWY